MADSSGWPGMSQLEREVFAELNLARCQPAAYSDHVANERLLIRDGYLARSGDVPVKLHEGSAAYEEAVLALRRQAPLPPLTAAPAGMVRAARAHAEDLAPGRTGHTGSDGSSVGDRLNRHGTWEGTCFECVGYGSPSARDVVVALLVDDGVASRGHRQAVLNPAARLCGVACGPHATYKTCCVVDFASDYSEDPSDAAAAGARNPAAEAAAATPLGAALERQAEAEAAAASGVPAPAYAGQTDMERYLEGERRALRRRQEAEAYPASFARHQPPQPLQAQPPRPRFGPPAVSAAAAAGPPPPSDVGERVLALVGRARDPEWAGVAKARRAVGGGGGGGGLERLARVRTVGLTKNVEFNDKIGTVTAVEREMGAVRVHLDGEAGPRLLLPQHLQVLPAGVPLQPQQFGGAGGGGGGGGGGGFGGAAGSYEQVPASADGPEGRLGAVDTRVKEILERAKLRRGGGGGGGGVVVGAASVSFLEDEAPMPPPSGTLLAAAAAVSPGGAAPHNAGEWQQHAQQQRLVSEREEALRAEVAQLRAAQASAQAHTAQELGELRAALAAAQQHAAPPRPQQQPPLPLVSSVQQPSSPPPPPPPPLPAAASAPLAGGGGCVTRMPRPSHMLSGIGADASAAVVPAGDFVELVIPNEPAQLTLSLGDPLYEELGGVYRLQGEHVNGAPLWRQVTGEGWLYCSPLGLWTVADDRAQFVDGSGFAATKDARAGRPPQAFARGDWNVLGVDGQWREGGGCCASAHPAAAVRSLAANATARVTVEALRDEGVECGPAGGHVAASSRPGARRFSVTVPPGQIVPLVNGHISVSAITSCTADFAGLDYDVDAVRRGNGNGNGRGGDGISTGSGEVYKPLSEVFPSWDDIGAQQAEQERRLQEITATESVVVSDGKPGGSGGVFAEPSWHRLKNVLSEVSLL